MSGYFKKYWIVFTVRCLFLRYHPITGREVLGFSHSPSIYVVWCWCFGPISLLNCWLVMLRAKMKYKCLCFLSFHSCLANHIKVGCTNKKAVTWDDRLPARFSCKLLRDYKSGVKGINANIDLTLSLLTKCLPQARPCHLQTVILSSNWVIRDCSQRLGMNTDGGSNLEVHFDLNLHHKDRVTD